MSSSHAHQHIGANLPPPKKNRIIQCPCKLLSAIYDMRKCRIFQKLVWVSNYIMEQHRNYNNSITLRLVDRASFINTLLLFQLDTLLFSFIHLQFYNFSLHVSDRLVHHQENQITLAASGTFPSFVVISCVAVGVN